MEWFSIAKNALKEAQIKIDKVLDIQDDDSEFIKEKSDNEQPNALISVPQQDAPVCTAPTLETRNIINDLELFYTNSDKNQIINTSNNQNTDLKTVEVPEDITSYVVEKNSQQNDTDENQDNDDLNDNETVMYNSDVIDKSIMSLDSVYLNTDSGATPKMETSMLSDYVQISDNIGDDEKIYNEELDTATSSSDIEIISNPNGDSSSTNSIFRGSPIKNENKIKTNPKKRHCRESSEISIQSEDSQTEIDKLMHRICELNEILENREMRLLDVNRQNATLNDKIQEYQKQLEAKLIKRDILDSEETQRLSTLEKKYQTSIRERDSLREQLNIMSSKVPKDDLNKIIVEKDFMIAELRTEGEKLSKQILQHSDIIKKLRVKERDSTSILKRNKEELESLTDEVDRLKKSLTAKDDLERTQIDAVHKLSSVKRKLEKDNDLLRNQIEDYVSKLETMQNSFDAVKVELKDKQQIHYELSRKAQVAANLETENKHTQNQNLEIMMQLEELRHRLTATDTENSVREKKLRQENADLLQRLEAAEIRAESLNNEVSLATIPLVKQLESLQATLNSRTKAWEKHEEDFLSKIKTSQESLEKLKNIENKSKESETIFKSRVQSLEDRLFSISVTSELQNDSVQQKEFAYKSEISEYKNKISELEEKIEESNRIIDELRHQQDEFDLNKNKFIINSDPDSQDTNTIEAIQNDLQQQNITNENRSPTLSLERNSMSESFNSAGWQMDDLEIISNSGRRDPGIFYGLNMGMGQSAAMLENLQSTLKQKDGEISQIQWELSRMQTERNFLNNEISNLTTELLEIKEKLQSNTGMENELAELKKQYDALLQMYGEKVEETQELELDLQDVKDMYRGQIDELLKQKNNITT